MSYREHAPPAALVPWLECIWERRGDGSPVRVLPDGCIDIVFSEGLDTQLIGANTTAFMVPVTPGARVVGARFHPGAAPCLLGIRAEAVLDTRLAVEHVWGEEGARLAAALSADPDPAGRLQGWLLSRLCRDITEPDPLVRTAVTRLASPAPRPITELARQLGVSDRQLRRRVAAAVGYGPKRLARVFRLRRALDAARAGDELARVAFDAGYADQAHFTNECRALAGAPPSHVLAATPGGRPFPARHVRP